MKIKAFFIIFKGLPLAKNYLRHESAPLIIVAKFLKNILKLLTGLQFDICCCENKIRIQDCRNCKILKLF